MAEYSSKIPASTRWVYWSLQLVAHLLMPIVALVLLWRSIKESAHLKGLHERIGLGNVPAEGAVWFFAASVGELRAASPLIKRFRSAGHDVVLTYQTPAGKAEGQRLFKFDQCIVHRFIPLDLFWAVRLFLHRARPKILVVLEIEIWPAMLMESDRWGIPLVMANGNLVEKSVNKRGRLRHHQFKLYNIFAAIFTRTDAYKQRYIQIGVRRDRVFVVGDLKYDQEHNKSQVELGQHLIKNWPEVSKVLLIASSVEGEEPALLNLVKTILDLDPTVGVIWAPRSPQRFDAVAKACTKIGYPATRRSNRPGNVFEIATGSRILLGDTIGEMDIWYSMADLVFVGASLVDHGGHNIIEPLSHGKPVVMGPSIFGIEFSANEAANIGAFESLPSEDALQARVLQLFATPSEIGEMAKNAEAFTHERRGASTNTFKAIDELC